MYLRQTLLSAGHNSKLRLLGISTVAGNQTVDKVTLNALGVVDAAGLQHISKYWLFCVFSQWCLSGYDPFLACPADVYKGQSRPLMRPLVSLLLLQLTYPVRMSMYYCALPPKMGHMVNC